MIWLWSPGRVIKSLFGRSDVPWIFPTHPSSHRCWIIKMFKQYVCNCIQMNLNKLYWLNLIDGFKWFQYIWNSICHWGPSSKKLDHQTCLSGYPDLATSNLIPMIENATMSIGLPLKMIYMHGEYSISLWIYWVYQSLSPIFDQFCWSKMVKAPLSVVKAVKPPSLRVS